MILLAFFGLLVYLTYLQFFKAEALANHPLNRRIAAWEEKVVRGGILTSDGEKLAFTEKDGENYRRVYPQGKTAAHILGYISPNKGLAGLEAAYAGELLGRTGLSGLKNQLGLLSGIKGRGNNLFLTIESSYQGLAEKMLSGRRGSIVVLDPATGKILALVSAPGYDPGLIDAQWPQLKGQKEQGPLLNRAINGVYSPGSVFKVITMAAALKTIPDVSQRQFYCPGYLKINGRVLEDAAVHGELNLSKALAVSCNTTFASLGMEMGAENLWEAAGQFGFNRAIPFELPVTPSVLSPGSFAPNQNGLAEAAIGQGTVTVTPLQMALAAAAIANKGVLMRPILVDHLTDASGKIISKSKIQNWLKPLTIEQADLLAGAMREAVTSGTAQKAKAGGLDVYGKTGTAQNSSGAAHSWFIGFARQNNRSVALAIVVEHAGAGGAVAAPLASGIFELFLSRN